MRSTGEKISQVLVQYMLCIIMDYDVLYERYTFDFNILACRRGLGHTLVVWKHIPICNIIQY